MRMAVNWRNARLWARRVVAITIGALGVFVVVFGISETAPRTPTEAVGVCALGMALISTAVGLWLYPIRRRILAIGLIAVALSLPLGTIIGTLLFNPDYFLKSFSDFAYFGWIFFIVAMTALAVWVLKHEPKTIVDVEGQVVPQTSSGISVASSTARVWDHRDKISQGSYVGAGLWFLAMLFVMLDSQAFTGADYGFFSFLVYLVLPIAILFSIDWIIGKRGAEAMKRSVSGLVALCLVVGFASPADAGYIYLCNKSERKIRAAVIIKTGMDYLTDTWAVKGWYYISKGDCEQIDGGWFGGGRSWGYVSIERELSAEALAYERKYAQKRHEEKQLEIKLTEIRDIHVRKRAALGSFSFYDHAVKYLPGSRQSKVPDEFNAEIEAVRLRALPPLSDSSVQGWDYLAMSERDSSLDEEGFTGTKFKTCLRKGGFNYSVTGKPSDQSSCSDGEILVPFTVEVWVTPNSDLQLRVGESSIESTRETTTSR